MVEKTFKQTLAFKAVNPILCRRFTDYFGLMSWYRMFVTSVIKWTGIE